MVLSGWRSLGMVSVESVIFPANKCVEAFEHFGKVRKELRLAQSRRPRVVGATRVHCNADSAIEWCFALQNSCGMASLFMTCALRIAVPLEFLVCVGHSSALPHAGR